MAFNFKTISIALSLLISALMIGAAFILSSETALSPNAASAGTTDELLKSYAAKDTDSDQLPDWEEALYGTNPGNPHTIDPKLTDKEAVDKGLVKPKYSATPAPAPTLSGTPAAPNTVTAAFGQELVKQFLLTGGTSNPSKEEVAQFVQNAIVALEKSQTLGDAYSFTQLSLTSDSEASLRAYVVLAEKAITQTPSDIAKSETDYISDLVTKGDASAASHVASIGASYTKVAASFSKVPVPAGAASAHLKITNALARMGDVMKRISAFPKDPLLGMLGLSEYEKSTEAMVSAFAEMGTYLKNQQVSLAKGDAGYLFFYTCSSAADVVAKKPASNTKTP